MATITKEVEMSKEAYELAMGLVEVVKSVKSALADGFQPAQDIPQIVLEAIQKLPAAIEGYDQLDDELKEDPIAFVQAFVQAGLELKKAL